MTSVHMSTDSKAASPAVAAVAAAARLATEFHPTQRLVKYTAPTVWHTFTPLAASSKAVNLGQGFPGWTPPDFVKTAAADASNEVKTDFMVHQYERPAGRLSLVNAIATRYSKSFGRTVDPINEVVVTTGCTQALFCALQGLINPGDEVVTLEPAFDIYWAQVDMCGGTLKTVPLRQSRDAAGNAKFTVDMQELASKFSSKTKAIILNTPHNPTGKVFSRDELEQIAALIKKWPNVVCIADEVYEHLTYDGHRHTSIATLPDMWQRTLTLQSAGKTFSVTGWKIGWAVGPAHLIRCMTVALQWVSFSVASVLQEGIARSLEEADKPYQGEANYYVWLQKEYLRKRGILADALTKAGITPCLPEGSFFIIGDTSNLILPDKWKDEKEPHDWNMCRWLTVDIGVAAIPPSSFYSDDNKPLARNLARFAFCKPDSVLADAAARLAALPKENRRA